MHSPRRRSPTSRRAWVAAIAAALVTIVAAPAMASPTAEEQQVVYELNRARWDPAAYRVEKGIKIPTWVTRRAPVAVNNQLFASARTTAHCTPSGDGHFCNGTGANGRVRAAGYPLHSSWPNELNFVESTYGGSTNHMGPIDGWLAGSDVHINHTLGQTVSYASHREIGVGHDGSGRWVVHTAHRASTSERLFVTGVVFADTIIGNQRMDLGEGRSGVTVELKVGTTVVSSTTTNAGGGYSLLVPSPGPYTVTATGNGVNATVPVVPVNHNVGLDFLTNGQTQLRQMDFEPGPELPLIAMADPTQGRWYFGDTNGNVTSFFFGNPGDYPLMGDWDCDGVRTPGMYRQANGLVYLRNSNTQGPAHRTFYFGNPGDIPIVGDFNDDDCDTVSIYRPSNQTFYIINHLGQNGGGLGPAQFAYVFGNPGDKPFVGDFNGNGQDTIGLHRESTGFVYFRNSHTQGNAHAQFYFGNPGDRIIAGDWNGNGTDTPGVFRPSNTTFYFRYTNTQGNADSSFRWGAPSWIPLYFQPSK
jgi:hypothetical protein